MRSITSGSRSPGKIEQFREDIGGGAGRGFSVDQDLLLALQFDVGA